MNKNEGFFWHVHHDKLVEWSDDIEERIRYIKDEKPKGEVATRLRLMKKVRGKLPESFVKAYKAWAKADKAWVGAYEARVEAYEAGVKAYEARVKADKAWDKTYEAWDKAYKTHRAEIEELHKKECGCKEWDGNEIVFVKEAGK